MSSWVVPGYAEVRVLGSGASGRVVAAVHMASGTRVAVKYLSPGYFQDPDFLARFRAEAQLLQSLGDPHVVRLLEYVEEPGQGAAIVMELVDGVSLHEMITSQGPAGPEAALLVLKGSLLGLAAAHALGIVHRDYKPENVLVDAEGTSKLTDFGIAVRAGHDAPAGGTPYYMAPEQWDGTPATPAADIYAATAVFFECLTGLTPFSGSLAELLAQHAAAEVPVALVDEPLRGLLARGMAKDPAARPASAAELVTELETAATAACGPGWEERGRVQLAERATALLLLLLHGPATAAASGTASSTVATMLTPKAGIASHASLSGWQLAAACAATFVVVSGAVAGAVVGVGGLVSSKHPASSPPLASIRPSAASARSPAAPDLVYATPTSVDLRAANGTVRTLATFPKITGSLGGSQFGSGKLAWSADGTRVAWLAGGKVGELMVGRDQVREWECGCGSIVFRGDQLLSDGQTTANAPSLVSYPDDGSKPVPITISGLPKSSLATSLNTFTLDAAISADDVIVGYGIEVGVSGGPQLLYRVDAQGRAVLFAPASSQLTYDSIPDGFTLSPDGTQVSFLVPGLAGVCADSSTAVVASTASGTEIHPPLPAGTDWAMATWFGPSGALYTSMAPTPPGCAHVGFGTVPDIVTSAQDYRLQGGTWVRSGNGIISQAPARGGWEATLHGIVDSTSNGAAPESASLKLVLSDGTASVTIPGTLAYLWAP
jgi:tRNA A-37 threonylcarbamoyl transferase component Bud32